MICIVVYFYQLDEHFHELFYILSKCALIQVFVFIMVYLNFANTIRRIAMLQIIKVSSSIKNTHNQPKLLITTHV